MHTRDEDCTLDERNVCRVCGVLHGEPCRDCGGRGFHRDGCPEFERLRALADPRPVFARGDVVWTAFGSFGRQPGLYLGASPRGTMVVRFSQRRRRWNRTYTIVEADRVLGLYDGPALPAPDRAWL